MYRYDETTRLIGKFQHQDYIIYNVDTTPQSVNESTGVLLLQNIMITNHSSPK